MWITVKWKLKEDDCDNPILSWNVEILFKAGAVVWGLEWSGGSKRAMLLK